MAKNTWDIEKKVGASFVSDSTIYRPNEQLPIVRNATLTKIVLANGSNAFIHPETKANTEALRLVWLEILESDTFRTKIEAYMNAGDTIRITTHLGETFTGVFTRVNRLWLRGVSDTYDLEGVLEITI